MPRTLHTGAFEPFPESLPDGILVIMFQRDTATKFGIPNYPLTRLATAAIRKRGLSIASSRTARHTLKRVIAAKYPGTDPAALASRLKNTLEIVLRTGIDPERLVRYGSSRVIQLGKIASAYRSELKKTGQIDQAALLWEASRSDPERRRLLVYGHHRARKEEVLFIDSIAGNGSEYFLPVAADPIFASNREWVDRLLASGWIESVGQEKPLTIGEAHAARFTDPAPNPSELKAFSYANVEAESRGTLSQVKELILAGTDPRMIAIVARDHEQYIRPLAAVAEEYGVPIRSKYSIPLGSTSLGGFLRLKFDAVEEGFRFESAARFLRHQYGPGVSEENFAAARMGHLSGYQAWAELCPNLDLAVWSVPASFQNWIDRLKKTLEAFGVRERSGRQVRESLAYNVLFDALYGLAPLEKSGEMPFRSFAATVSEILSDEAVPFLPGDAGIEVLTPDDVIGRSYDHVFLMGMAEGVYPRPATDDPVVDFHERRDLASSGILFAEAAEIARWEDLSFYFALAAARSKVYLSLPKMTGNGDAFPSSYLKRIGIETPVDAPGLNVVSSVEELRTAQLRHDVETADQITMNARQQYRVESDRESSAPFGEYDGVIGVPHRASDRKWSASQLTTIGQCSFKWFAQRLLRLRPLEEMEYGLDPATRGLLYHKTLEIAVTKAMNKPDIRAAVLDCLADAFADAELDEEVGLPVLPNWEKERLEQINELRKAIAAPDFILDGSRVVGVEQYFEETWQGFPLTGYIDRVDDTPHGLVAIDYKTSGSVPKGAKDETGKLTVDVQIPLYANVALRKLYPDGRYGNSVYYSLTKGKILRENKPDDMDKLERLAESVKAKLGTGSFAVDPDTAGYACTYCDFDSVCRKGSRLRRKART